MSTDVVYRKTKNGKWAAYGPLAAFKETIDTPDGPDTITVDRVTVTKKSGEQMVEMITGLGKPFKVDGVDHVYGYIAEKPRRNGRRESSADREDFGGYSDTGH